MGSRLSIKHIEHCVKFVCFNETETSETTKIKIYKTMPVPIHIVVDHAH